MQPVNAAVLLGMLLPVALWQQNRPQPLRPPGHGRAQAPAANQNRQTQCEDPAPAGTLDGRVLPVDATWLVGTGKEDRLHEAAVTRKLFAAIQRHANAKGSGGEAPPEDVRVLYVDPASFRPGRDGVVTRFDLNVEARVQVFGEKTFKKEGCPELHKRIVWPREGPLSVREVLGNDESILRDWTKDLARLEVVAVPLIKYVSQELRAGCGCAGAGKCFSVSTLTLVPSRTFNDTTNDANSSVSDAFVTPTRLEDKKTADLIDRFRREQLGRPLVCFSEDDLMNLMPVPRFAEFKAFWEDVDRRRPQLLKEDNAYRQMFPGPTEPPKL